MPHDLLTLPQVEYRNFNLCPHCELLGQDPLLVRMSEGMPMISRSDGKNFHLVLTDRPLSYPAELHSDDTWGLSVCFWYSLGRGRNPLGSSVVLMPTFLARQGSFYREIEVLADLLAEKLLQQQRLAVVYHWQGNFLREVSY